LGEFFLPNETINSIFFFRKNRMNHQGKTAFFLKLLQKALPFDEPLSFSKEKDNVTFSKKSKDFSENDPN
jgi:hypothetical protein